MRSDSVLRRENLGAFTRALMHDSVVVAPVRVGEQVFFRPIRSETEVYLGENSRVPPAEHLMPQSETMFHYEKRGSEVDLSYTVDQTRRTILGIRPCDVYSLGMLDEVFSGRYEDPYYLTRRSNTMLVSLMCNEPGHSCFCHSFGTGPDLDAAAGSDIHLVDLGERFYVQVFSERGQQVVDGCGDMFAPATADDRAAAQQTAQQSVDMMQRTLDTDGLSEALSGMFESNYWDDISRKCLSCGACTYLCPVCYCFDVSDTCSQVAGERTRCWDACTFRSFAMLAGGHNPRPSIREGYRQKMYHKFHYAVERHGHSLCVGCGRCLDGCPVNLDIVKVLTGAKELTRRDMEVV